MRGSALTQRGGAPKKFNSHKAWLLTALAALPLASAAIASDGALYEWQDGTPRWASPENPEARKGAGGHENKGAKGHAFNSIAAGDSLTLADVSGPGIIDRMWITVDDRSAERLRALRLDIYWDGADKPAVSVPLGDLYGAGAGALVPMDTALVASPEGRSFLSYIPMPFAKGARVVVTNESDKELALIFHDVNFRRFDKPLPDAMYFHAYWSRAQSTELGTDFQVLPKVSGRGRFVGTIVTTLTNPAYGKSWWGEGEAKIFLDGDKELATLVGTGTED